MSKRCTAKQARRIALARDKHGHPLCPYCDQRPKLVPTAEVYGRHYGCPGAKMWVCAPCDARVGCHGDTSKPLGNLANAATRQARMQAHAAFDPVWKTGFMRRGAAYGWLAQQMGVAKEFCHISWMDVEACEEVARICMAHPAHERETSDDH